jgi:hypothetical protein
MTRYLWQTVCESPQRYQLFDIVTERPIATVEQVDRHCWEWVRTTNYLLHGAQPAKGTAETLLKAKIAIVHDLSVSD